MKTAEELKHSFIKKHGYPETRLLSSDTVNEELISELDQLLEQSAKERSVEFAFKMQNADKDPYRNPIIKKMLSSFYDVWIKTQTL